MRLGAAMLSVLALSAAAAVAYLWLDPQTGEARPQVWSRPPLVKPDLPTLDKRPDVLLPAADPSSYVAMLERPLFAVDRRPPPPPKVVVEPPPDPLNTLQVVGLFSGQFSGVIANVEGRTRRIKVQDKVGDWTLEAIERRDAVFVRGDEKRTVGLVSSRWGSAPKAVTASAPVRPATPGTITAQTPEAERARIQQEQEAERWRIVNEIRAKAGMLRP